MPLHVPTLRSIPLTYRLPKLFPWSKKHTIPFLLTGINETIPVFSFLSLASYLIFAAHFSAMNPSAKIFAGTGSESLAQKICKSYGCQMGKINIQKFSDGEIQPIFLESIRGDFVFLVASTYSPADNLMELLLMIDAARRASAYKIIVVIPYYGYARQDRKDRPRVAIGSKLVANMLVAAGANRVITMDLHA